MNLKNIIEIEKNKKYYKNIIEILKYEYCKKKIFPNEKKIFSCLNKKMNEIKVVIVGQDPYPNDLSTGFAFSTHNNIITKSLKNIFYELKRSIKNFKIPNNGSLIKWILQGVVLLNSILTVENQKPLSHEKIGWLTFTDKVIKFIDENCKNIFFLLWGKIACKKKIHIFKNKKTVLCSAHPVNDCFIGNNHFNIINEFHLKNNLKVIKW